MMHKLTKRQQEVLDLITNHMNTNGAPPTRAEIANTMGFRSPNAAEDHLRALAKKGVIELVPGTSRGIRLNRPTKAANNVGLPIVNNTTAEKPILSSENIESHYSFDKSLFNQNADYLLKIKDNSMQKAGILNGDLLVVNKTTQAENGQVVVAKINNEVTVKRLKKEDGKVFLLPENDSYSPIEITPFNQQTFSIEGIGVGAIRTSF